ncbi:MAG: phosphonate ABC transporter, permease protein PhnE [Anaerolineae bacterium]|nr:phosphonate ABC transporter, permease protein PhnE [Anaerolineae bacterium]
MEVDIEMEGRMSRSAALSKTTFDSRDQLLNPMPRITVSSIVAVLMLVAVYIWGFRGTKADPAELVEGIPNIINFIVRLFPPEFALSKNPVALPAFVQSWFGAEAALPVPEIIFAIIETIQMAIIGTTFSVFLSMPFGLLAARNTSPHPAVYQSTRMILNMIRAVPEIIFALIFVAAVGLGPFGGVLALAVGSIGFLGKLYAESIEAIDPQQVLALRATGANPLHVFRYSVVPQALPLIASYTLYLFEHNVRSATILGLVGAGGVGFVITKYLALFQYRRLMGALILVILTVTLVDRLSDQLRRRFT